MERHYYDPDSGRYEERPPRPAGFKLIDLAMLGLVVLIFWTLFLLIRAAAIAPRPDIEGVDSPPAAFHDATT